MTDSMGMAGVPSMSYAAGWPAASSAPSSNATGLVPGPGQVVVAPKQGDLVSLRAILTGPSHSGRIVIADVVRPTIASALRPLQHQRQAWAERLLRLGSRSEFDRRKERRLSAPPRGLPRVLTSRSNGPTAAHRHAIVGPEHLQRDAAAWRLQERHAERGL